MTKSTLKTIVTIWMTLTGCGFLCAALPPAEEAALVDLYQATNGVGWVDSTGWLVDSDPCTWFGVTCDAGGSTVEALDLSANNLDGPLPPSLGDLSSLTALLLPHNSLRGAIPVELGSLLQLQQLDLNDNHLEGPVPTELGALVQLQVLSVPRNRLTGALPSSLENLTSLTDDGGLDLRWNGVFTTDDALRAFLNSKQEDGDWEGSQTVAPGDLFATVTKGMLATLVWDPIDYTDDIGRYEVYGATVSGGPYEMYMSTSESFPKGAGSGDVGPLLPGASYYLVLRTVTYPHPENPRNVVVSDFSTEVEITIDPRTAYYVDPDGDDGNDCLTPNTACATVNGAFARAAESPGPFYIAPGTYPGDVDIGGDEARHVIGSGVSDTIIAGHVSVWADVHNSYAALEDLTLSDGVFTGGDFSGGTPFLFLRDAEIRGSSGSGVATNDWGVYWVFDTVTIAENKLGVVLWAGIASFRNCTVSGNWDDRFYGLNLGDSTLEKCTVAGNAGWGLAGNDHLVRLIDTIIAGNGAGDCQYSYVESGGHNLDGDGSCGLNPLLGDLQVVDPLLGPLRNNGGETRTHGLLYGSPAIDAGAVGSPAKKDQRGAPRPIDGDGDGTPRGDIGAVEFGLPFGDGFETGELSAWSAISPPDL